jgi:hypothetical protein
VYVQNEDESQFLAATAEGRLTGGGAPTGIIYESYRRAGAAYQAERPSTAGTDKMLGSY